MTDQVYDCILTDPPWPVKTGRGTKSGRPGISYNTMPITDIRGALNRFSSHIPPHGFMVVMAPDSFRDVLNCEFTPLERRRPGIWWKVNGGMGYGLKRDFEDIHYWTGKKWKPNSSIQGVLPVPRGHDRYCTSKPVLLWHYLLEAFAQPGWIVYDPFCGGGGVGEACKLLKMNFILEDIKRP